LSGRAPDEAATHTAAFFRALAEAGYVPGRNLTVEYRWAEGRYDRLPMLAKDLTPGCIHCRGWRQQFSFSGESGKLDHANRLRYR